MHRKTIILIVIFSAVLMACPEIETLSPIPEVNFRKLEFVTIDTIGTSYTVGLLEFGFVDGDANLGVYDEVNKDTSLPDSVKFGLFISFFEKNKGVYSEITNPNDSLFSLNNYLIPYDQKMDRVGQNKTIKGVIRVQVPLNNINVQGDTFMLEFFIRDRALNKSNVERTNDFTLPSGL